MFVKKATALLAAGLAAFCARSAELRPEWELPAAHLRDNGFNGEVVLNGFWELRGCETGAPTVVRVPHIYGKSGSNLYSRCLLLPPSWEKRRLLLELVGQQPADGAVAWNGRTIGFVKARAPFQSWELPPSPAGVQSVTLGGGLVRGDLWLRSYTREHAIEDSYITTSTRAKSVRLALSGRAPPDSRVELLASVFDSPGATNLVKTLRGEARADARGLWSAALDAPWPDAEWWSPRTPRLYAYSAEARAGGRVLDRQLPRPFGFREVWVEGPTVYLNGAPLRFTGDTWNGLFTRDCNANVALADAVIPLLKSEGVTAVHRVENDLALDLCARHGLLTMAYAGGLDIPTDWQGLLKPGEAGDDGGDSELRNMKDPKLDASRETLRKRIRRWRENPAVLCWTVRSPWNRSTLNSLMQGNTPDPWRYWPGNGDEAANRFRYEVADRTIAFVRSLDPSRPVGTQNSPASDIEWSTRYLCINLDLAERAAFFDAYATNAHARALWPSEYQEIFHGHHFIRKQPLQIPQNDRWPSLHLENAARQFGESVYLEPSDDELSRWNLAWGETFAATPPYQRLVAENASRSFRGWRTSGVSGFAHWQMREGYQFSRTKKTSLQRLGLPAEDVDPRHPGFSQFVGDPKKPTGHPLPGVDDRLPGGEAYKRAIAPVLAYLGGAEGAYNNRDHLYVAGQKIRKTLVGVNDRPSAVRLQGSLTAAARDGAPAFSAAVDCRLGPGERQPRLAAFELTAPAVAQRTDYELRLALTDSAGGAHEDRFAFTVFPATQGPAERVRLRPLAYLAPRPDALTTELERRYGARPVGDAIPRDSLLVVARRAFADERSLARLKALDLDAAVAAGARVLVLEQAGTNVMGLKTEDVRPRSCFIAAEGHPAFEGLAGSDFEDWTGASDLEEGAQPITEATRLQFPARIWHVNAENAVATRTFVRPQTGAARALLVSGFDLMETPLLEVAQGRGRLLFCQLDVSSRYGKDPVATRVVDNLLRYLSEAPDADPAKGEVAVASGPQVALRPATFRLAKPAGADGWGVTQAELFNREAIWTNNWVTKKRPSGDLPVFADQIAQRAPTIIRKEAERFVMSLDDKAVSTGWAAQKILFIRAALIVNQGGGRLDGPRLAVHGDAKALYPRPWIEGFVHPYTAACW